MNENTEVYIEQFNKLENTLKERLRRNNGVSFSALVNEGAKRDPFIRKHKSLLDSFRELRNVLIHEEGNEIIATPTDAAVRAITKMVDIYTRPDRLDKMFTQKVVSVNPGQSLKVAMDYMKYHGYGTLPVYDKEGCIGLLSSRVLMKWLLVQYDDMGKIMVDTNTVKIGEILDQVDRIDRVKIVPRTMDVISFLDERSKDPSPSGIYILTESGKSHEKPVGIITDKDIPAIYDRIKMD